MNVVNATSRARTVAATQQTVEPGASANVPDAVGESLLEQSDVWSKSKKTEPAPSGAGKTGDEPKKEG